MNRLYAIESTPTLTGAKADHRLTVKAAEVERGARAGGRRRRAAGRQPPGGPPGAPDIATLGRGDRQGPAGTQGPLGSRRRRVPDRRRPRRRQAINDALGNTGTTVIYGASVEAIPAAGAPRSPISRRPWTPDRSSCSSSWAATRFSRRPSISVSASGWQGAARRLPRSHVDETAPLCHWNVPATHALESWGDARFDGTVTLTQPLIAPLYEGQSAHDFLGAFTAAGRRRGARDRQGFLDQPTAAGPGGGRSSIRAARSFPNADAFWRAALHDGFIAGTA